MSDRQVSQHDELDRALRACDPIGGRRLAPSGIEAAFDALTTAIVTEPRQTRPKWRVAARPRRALAGIAAFALLSAGVAVGATKVFVATYTHRYPPKGMIAGGGPGQLLAVDGTDFNNVAIQLSSDIPYPARYASWRQSVASAEFSLQQQACPPGSPASCAPQMPSGALHVAFADSAFAAWVLEWRRDMMAGQQAAGASDARVISEASSWSAVTAWDPHPSMSVPGDMGTTHPSPFGWTIPFTKAVSARDLAGVNQAIVNDAKDGGQFAWWVNVGMGLNLRLGLVGQPLLTYLDDHNS
jgi:hypothetical protein